MRKKRLKINCGLWQQDVLEASIKLHSQYWADLVWSRFLRPQELLIPHQEQGTIWYLALTVEKSGVDEHWHKFSSTFSLLQRAQGTLLSCALLRSPRASWCPWEDQKNKGKLFVQPNAVCTAKTKRLERNNGWEFISLRNHESLWRSLLEGKRAELHTNPALTQLSHYINPADRRDEIQVLSFWVAAEVFQHQPLCCWHWGREKQPVAAAGINLKTTNFPLHLWLGIALHSHGNKNFKIFSAIFNGV